MNSITDCVDACLKAKGGIAALAALVFVLVACGNGSTNDRLASPSPTPSPGGGTATITIANNAVSAQSVTVTRGSRVAFLNNDTRSHDIQSNPHPTHTDCPEINQVGFLNPGESRQTGVLNNARTCGFHDHLQDTVRSLQGTITIQ
jgi:plastocyanin